MSLLSLLLALLVEHFYPLDHRIRIFALYARYVAFLERRFNAGRHWHGMLAWLLGVLLPLAVAAAVYWGAYRLSPVLALAWNAAVLYAVMGFKYFSNTSSAVADALKGRDLAQARDLLGKWRGGGGDGLDASEVARLGIEQSLICAHRQMFGVIAWFVLLAPFGPVGAVLYRAASILARKWGGTETPESDEFGAFATRIFAWLDWVPARLTAAAFAIMGDFEDAIYCWRTQASDWINKAEGVILSSGAGALGIRLGEAVHPDGEVQLRPELGLGDEVDADYMQSAISLIWRALGLWLVILLMIQLARWAG
jgi:cobalamin biosynthesis protein CobD/CbiB